MKIAILILLIAVSATAATITPGDVAITPRFDTSEGPALPHVSYLQRNTLAPKAALQSRGALAFGPDGRLYVSPTPPGIDVYDSSLNKTQIVTAALQPGVSGLAVFANGDFLVLSTYATTLYVLSPAGAVKQSFPLTGPFSSGLTAFETIDLAPDQCTVFYVRETSVGRFNVCTGLPLADVPGGAWRGVRAFVDGGYVVVRDSTLSVYDAHDQPVRTMTSQFADPTSLSFDVDPHTVVVGTAHGVAKVSLASGNVITSIGGDIVAVAVAGEQRPASADVAVQDIPSLSPRLLFALALGLIALAWLRLRA